MYQYRIRIRNKIRQLIYRPRRKQSSLISTQVSETLTEIDRQIEKKITPLLSELFK
ncbi:MAG: hypothetical protein FWC73_02250 [Defluviitaleaceae bacterium]|nr:hypothetical protein [Defluviitaleaceae bacterium]